jgi:hypothetical protein
METEIEAAAAELRDLQNTYGDLQARMEAEVGGVTDVIVHIMLSIIQ